MRLHVHGTGDGVRKVVGFALVAFAGLNSGCRMAAQTPDADRWAKLYAANNIGVEGAKPFHLEMTFQLYSLEGKAAETGTIEEWWYSQQDHHTVIHSRSLNRDSDVPDAFEEKTAREKYLVDDLLNLTLRPVPKRLGRGDLNEEDRSFGKATLHCLGPKTASVRGMIMMSSAPTICTEKQTDVVRAVLFPETSKALLRNAIGKLGDVAVGMDEQIQWFDRQAIAGKVTALTALEPKVVDAPPGGATGDGAPATKIVSPLLVGTTARVAGGIVAGMRTKFVQPEYPEIAKRGHMSGMVLMGAVISKEGTIEKLVSLASTDPIFSEAAMGAVRQWQYKPYMLNGAPAEVETTITVNFNLSPQRP